MSNCSSFMRNTSAEIAKKRQTTENNSAKHTSVKHGKPRRGSAHASRLYGTRNSCEQRFKHSENRSRPHVRSTFWHKKKETFNLSKMLEKQTLLTLFDSKRGKKVCEHQVARERPTGGNNDQPTRDLVSLRATSTFVTRLWDSICLVAVLHCAGQRLSGRRLRVSLWRHCCGWSLCPHVSTRR